MMWLAEKDLLSLAACEQALHVGNMVGSHVSVAHERRGKSRGNFWRSFCLLLKMESLLVGYVPCNQWVTVAVC